MPENALGLMARYPQPGRVKTRLAAEIGTQRAYDVYRKLLDRAIAQVVRHDPKEILRIVFIEPAEAVNNFAARHDGFDQVRPQTAGDLGLRMQRALEYLLALPGISRACLIGADIPEITKDLIGQAWQLLIDNDLVLGPTVDGGYYLIGMKQVYPSIFTGVGWGTNEVWDSTVVNAQKQNLTVGRLPLLRDLDDLDDLKHFAANGVFDW